jgi:hypothetical protein
LREGRKKHVKYLDGHAAIVFFFNSLVHGSESSDSDLLAYREVLLDASIFGNI